MKPYLLLLGLGLTSLLGQDPAPSPAPPPPAVPAPAPSGGVPEEAAGFRGKVTGIVETIAPGKKRLKIKVTSVVPGEKCEARKPQTMVTRVVEVLAGGVRDEQGEFHYDPEHLKWITALNPGAEVTLEVRFLRYGNRLRLTALPGPPRPGVQAPPESP